jgi:hypothetical protein
VATDIPWLAFANESYMSNGAMRFDPPVSDKLWFAEGIGVWYTPATGDAARTTWTSASAGIEQLVGRDVKIPPGSANVITAGMDRSVFVVPRGNTAYPSRYGTEATPAASIIHAWAVNSGYVIKKHILAIDGVDPHTVYLHFYGHGIWRSADDAATWTEDGPFPFGSLDEVNAIAASQDVYGDRYLAFQGSGWAYGKLLPWARSGPGHGGLVPPLPEEVVHRRPQRPQRAPEERWRQRPAVEEQLRLEPDVLQPRGNQDLHHLGLALHPVGGAQQAQLVAGALGQHVAHAHLDEVRVGLVHLHEVGIALPGEVHALQALRVHPRLQAFRREEVPDVHGAPAGCCEDAVHVSPFASHRWRIRRRRTRPGARARRAGCGPTLA